MSMAVQVDCATRWSGVASGSVPWTLLLGDARERLADLTAESFHCVVTSPPYYSLRDYGVDGQIGLEDNVVDYLKAISDTMTGVYRVLRNDGVLFLNLGDTYYSGKGKSHGEDPKSAKRRFGLRAVDKSGGVGIGIRPKSAIGIPWRVAFEMINNGWVLRSSIIWHRKNALPEAVKDRPRRSYEHLFMFAKGRRYYFNRAALSNDDVGEDVWTIQARPRPTNGIDTAPYPDELVQRCLDLGCPATGSVLDPFVGGGTTMRVALDSGRAVTGIELNRQFCQYVVGQLEKKCI